MFTETEPPDPSAAFCACSMCSKPLSLLSSKLSCVYNNTLVAARFFKLYCLPSNLQWGFWRFGQLHARGLESWRAHREQQ